MPKRIIDEDEESQFAEDEQEMEQEIEEEEQEQPEPQPNRRTMAARHNLPPLPTLPPARPRGNPQFQKRQPPQPPVKRYQGFVQQAAEGVVDTETQEVIATDIWTALANIIERLERIENSIGSMMK